MTVRLLTNFDRYPTNAIVTLAAGTEAGLIAGNMATSNLTGGVVWVEPVDEPSVFPGLQAAINAGLVSAPTASMLSIAARLDTYIGPDGTRYRSNATSAVAGTALVAIGTGTGGTTALFGSGLPSAGLGSDGNTYHRTDREGYIYEKVTGAWVLRIRPQFEWLDVRGAEILTTCNPAATWITAYQSVDLREFLTGTSTCMIRVGIGCGAQSATAKDWQIGIGTTLSNAMTGGTGTTAGRLMFDAIGFTDTTAKWDVEAGFAMQASLDSQVLVNSSGDAYGFRGNKLGGQNKQTGSVVLSGGTPVYLFIGVKSATNTDVIGIRNLELWVTRL